MSASSLSIGTRVKHPVYGNGIVLDNSMSAAYTIVFKHHGEKAIAKDLEGLEVIELAPLPENRIGLGDLTHVIEDILRKWGGFAEEIPIASRWKGGNLIMQPADPSLKPKEIDIETFFHKIVMIRDRLRVLEQNINSNKSLSEADKVQLQQYITRCYGSLTTFNILFKNQEDGFKGESKR